MLSLSGVTKQIGGLTAVNNVDMQIDADEIVGLVGPNGAGKTTLLNIISGVLPPTAGNVTFMGEDITGLRNRQNLPPGNCQDVPDRKVLS